MSEILTQHVRAKIICGPIQELDSYIVQFGLIVKGRSS
jgi:hypothetical protein